jgi:hopanoid biosynthesis associated RND transporter like protein HpnN
MSFVHRVLQYIMGKVARVVCAVPGIIVVVGVVLAVLSTFVVVTRWNVLNNTSDLLSNKYKPMQYYNELRKDFGSDYRYIILIQSDNVAQNRAAADEIGQWLPTVKPQIGLVLSKIDFSTVRPRLLFTRDTDDLKKIATQIEDEISAEKANQKSSEQVSQTALDLNSILNEANADFSDTYLRKKSNWADFKKFVPRFVDILNKISAQAEGKTLKQMHLQSSDSDGNSSNFEDTDADELLTQHEYFSLQDGKTVLVFAYTNEKGAETDSESPFSKATQKIRDYLKGLEAKYPGSTIELTGEPALDTDIASQSNLDAAKAGAITVVLIIALFFFSYRAVFRPAVTIFVLIMAVLWSLGFALLTVGHFNVLSIAVIPMVLGIGIDFGIQILGRYEEELGLGKSVPDAVTTALQHTGIAIITGGSTTAAAFFTLCFNDFIGLAELGLIAGFSMIFCITANLVVLPAVFILRDRNRTTDQLHDQSSNSSWNFIHSWDRDMVRNPWLWIIISVAISIAAAISLPNLRFDYNLLHLDNPYAQSVISLHKVMDASKNDQGNEISTIYASVVAQNVDDARQLSRKLAALPTVAKVESVLELLPEGQDEKLPIIKRIVEAGSQLNVKTPTAATPVDIPRAQRDIHSLHLEAIEALKQATAYAGISKIAKDAVEAFKTMIPALERADKALNDTPMELLKKRFAPSSNGAFSQMQKNMALLKSQKADRGLELQDIPPQLQRLFVSKDGKILLQVYGKKDLWERGPDEAFVKEVISVAPNATGTPVLNYYATDLMRVAYVQAAGWAFLAIVVLIFAHFQSFKFLLLTLTPLVLAVLWRTGAMVWFGIEFNPANIVTLPLIIGVDVAFGVYIIDRYREDGRLSIFEGSTGKAIIMSSLTSLFGFASLLASQFRGMWDIGQLMSIGIAIGLVTAIFILPQILALIKPTTKP